MRVGCKDKKSQIITSAETGNILAGDSSDAYSGGVADELVFMIQITASVEKKEIKPENFKGLKEITEIPSDDRFRYAAGAFADYQEAADYRKEITAIYPDAFVIAVKNNKILPLQEALNLKQ